MSTSRWDFSGFEGYYGFDVEGERDERIQVGEYINEKSYELSFDSKYPARVNVTNAEENRAMFLEMYGGLFFLGIFLGTTFIMATALIMYYKQISEGFEDKERFEIMQKVGMSKAEVKKAIKSQVLSVFFLPLIAACVHIAFAFRIITQLLLVLNLTKCKGRKSERANVEIGNTKG